MMYIQLSLPYRTYDRVIIKSVHLYEDYISIFYAITNSSGAILFEKSFNITSTEEEYNSILKATPNINFTIEDNFDKLFLEYMINNSIETGTLEIK